MHATYIPTPGWIAMRLGRYGHEPLLSVMAAGVLDLTTRCAERGYPLEEAEINPYFLELSADDDPLYTLEQTWATQTAAWPYLAGHVGVFTDWLVDAPQERAAAVRAIATTLANVDFYGMSHTCRTGILASVHNELVAIAERRGEPVVYRPIWQTTIDAARIQAMTKGGALERGESVADFACAGGNRLVAMAAAAAMLGRDPATLQYYAADWDPVAVAITGVSLACFALPHVHLTSTMEEGTEWAHRIDLLWMDMTEMAERIDPLMVEIIDAAVDDDQRQIVREALATAVAETMRARGPRPVHASNRQRHKARK